VFTFDKGGKQNSGKIIRFIRKVGQHH